MTYCYLFWYTCQCLSVVVTIYIHVNFPPGLFREALLVGFGQSSLISVIFVGCYMSLIPKIASAVIY